MEKIKKLAEEGCTLLLQKQFYQAGIDLATDFIDVWVEKKVPVTSELIDLITNLNKLFIDKKDEEGLRLSKRFLDASIEWSLRKNNTGNYLRGEPKFHELAAATCGFMKDYKSENDHLVHSHQPKLFAAFLTRISTKSYSTERDLLICRGVLQLLTQENLKDANELFSLMTNDSKEEKEPLLNFVSLLLLCLERDAAPLFETLKEKYVKCLSADPQLLKYVEIVGRKFFNIQNQQMGMAGMMQNMMKMFAH